MERPVHLLTYLSLSKSPYKPSFLKAISSRTFGKLPNLFEHSFPSLHNGYVYLTDYLCVLNKVDESIWHTVGFQQQFLTPFYSRVDSELLERLLLKFSTV